MAVPTPNPAVGLWPGSGTDSRGRALTWFPHMQDLAEGQGKLDAAPGKRALVFIFTAAVLQDKLRDTGTITAPRAHTPRAGRAANELSEAGVALRASEGRNGIL